MARAIARESALIKSKVTAGLQKEAEQQVSPLSAQTIARSLFSAGQHVWLACVSEPQRLVSPFDVESYSRGRKLGEGVWAVVSHGWRETPPWGIEEVAIKELKEDKQGAEEQRLQMELECRVHRFVYQLSQPLSIARCGQAAIQFHARHCAKVPRLLGYEEGTAVIDFVEGVTLEAHLRRDYKNVQRSLDTIEVASLRRLCDLVLQKVCNLLLLGRRAGFSHRDLNDGNVMLGFKRGVDEPVASLDDVDVWLIDFGKSMATIDGEEVRALRGGEGGLSFA